MEKHVQKSRPLGRTRSTYQGVGLAPSKRVFSLLVVLLLIAAAPYQLLAADRYVKASADGLSAPFDGSSWDHPLIGFAGIKTAYEAGDDVYVAAGLYTSTSSLEKRSGNKIHGGFPANATGTDKSGYNPINNPTTIDGANTYKIFGGTVGVADFTMKGIRFIRSNGGASAGGVYCAAGPATQRVTFTDCVFKDNRSAAGYAGVAYFASVTSDASYIRFYNCVFDGNQSQHHGGALGFSTVYNHGNTNTGAFVIDGCSFVNNRNDGSGDDEGGAIYFTTSHGWTIRNSNFCSNRATLRGGALVFTTSHDNIITGSTFSTNGLLPSGDSNGDGGAIYVTTGQVDISNSTFTENTINNTTSNLGGAIYGTTATIGLQNTNFIKNSGGRGGAVYGTTASFTISGSGFYENEALAGGGLMSTTWRVVPSTIDNSIFYGNKATSTGAAQDAGRWGGGALCLDANANQFDITNTKFVNNSVPSQGWGGAISIYDLQVNITGSLFYNNTKGGDPSISGSDLKNYNTAGDFSINNTKVQLANAAAYTNQVGGGSNYGFGTGNTFSNTDNGGVTNLVVDAATCPVGIHPFNTVPDFNVTVIDVPVTGNVSTNDATPPGTTYGTPVADAGNPSGGGTITMNPDGTYTFTGTEPGVYVYEVPVCSPGSTEPCPTETLTITVQKPGEINPPVANPDYATGTGSATGAAPPITSVVKANDGPGNAGGALGAPALTSAAPPANVGTIAVSGDNVVFTPAQGFYGEYVATYEVCETPGVDLCATTTVTFLVKEPDAPNTTAAADDYVSTPQGTAVTGNVKTNDTDPEGHAQTVTAQTGATVSGKGTLDLAADGSFTFTPAAGFTGPVEFVYTTCDSEGACANATLHILVTEIELITVPDFNVTNINVPVTGDVSTNDTYPPGTTYGTPVADAGNPDGGGTITMNPDGTYTFTGTEPGVYVYEVPVCTPGSSEPCPTETLTITVLEPGGTNDPVANPDYATGTGSATGAAPPITSVVKANDGPGNTGGTLGTPALTSGTPPASVGTIAVSGDNVVFTPAQGFYGEYVATYEVCETPGVDLCATTTVTFLVKEPNSPNSTAAADDYVSTPLETPVTGNVKTNDTDPEGHAQTVTAQTGATVSGKGTLDLAADGSFTFTPAAGFTGPVEFVYTTCDSEGACANATLHILVTQTEPNTVPDFNVTYINVPVTGDVSTNDTNPPGTTYGTPIADAGNPDGGGTITMNPDGTYTFTGTVPGVYVYEVPVCTPGTSAPCPTETLTITVQDPGGNNPPVANPDYATGTGSATGAAPPITSVVKANDGPGNTEGTLGTPTLTSGTPPVEVGTIAVDGENIVFTPAEGFYGEYEATYQVCETPGGLCAATTVTFLVKEPGSSNTTAAADDYITASSGVPATGNVKTNDTDPEGHVQTVTAQTGATVSGKGTLDLAADGSFTFTAVPGFYGPVEFVYTTCDSEGACANATLHVLVTDDPDLVPILTVTPSNTTGTSPLNVVIDVYNLPANAATTDGSEIRVLVSKDVKVSLTFNSSETTVGGLPVQNSKWTFDNSNPIFYVFTTTEVIDANDVLSIGLTGTINPGTATGKLTVTTIVQGGSGGELNVGNNSDAEAVLYHKN